jgi:hypothetical protein
LAQGDTAVVIVDATGNTHGLRRVLTAASQAKTGEKIRAGDVRERTGAPPAGQPPSRGPARRVPANRRAHRRGSPPARQPRARTGASRNWRTRRIVSARCHWRDAKFETGK